MYECLLQDWCCRGSSLSRDGSKVCQRGDHGERGARAYKQRRSEGGAPSVVVGQMGVRGQSSLKLKGFSPFSYKIGVKSYVHAATTSPYLWSMGVGEAARSAHAWIRQCVEATDNIGIRANPAISKCYAVKVVGAYSLHTSRQSAHHLCGGRERGERSVIWQW